MDPRDNPMFDGYNFILYSNENEAAKAIERRGWDSAKLVAFGEFIFGAECMCITPRGKAVKGGGYAPKKGDVLCYRVGKAQKVVHEKGQGTHKLKELDLRAERIRHNESRSLGYATSGACPLSPESRAQQAKVHSARVAANARARMAKAAKRK